MTAADLRKNFRWLPVLNTEDTPIPPYGVVEIIGVASDGAAVRVRRPASDSLAPARLLLLGASPIGPEASGAAHAIYPGLALYESSGGVLALGGELGTAGGSYKLVAGNGGFRALEVTTAGQDGVLVAPDSMTGGTFTGPVTFDDTVTFTGDSDTTHLSGSTDSYSSGAALTLASGATLNLSAQAEGNVLYAGAGGLVSGTPNFGYAAGSYTATSTNPGTGSSPGVYRAQQVPTGPANMTTNAQPGAFQLGGQINGAATDFAGTFGTYTGNGTTRSGTQTQYTYLNGSRVDNQTLNTDGTTTFAQPVTPVNGGHGATTALGGWDALANQTRDSETLGGAATLDLGAVTSWGLDAGGTSDPGGIISLGTASAGVVRAVRFTSAGLLIKHNASIILPGGTDITTLAGDVAVFQSLGAGVWLCVSYDRYLSPLSTTPLTSAAIGVSVQGYDATLAALATFNTDGIICQTAADTFAGRTLTAGSGIAVTNGNGVAGNPTAALDVTGLTAADLAATDEVPIYDASATANRKVTFERFAGLAAIGVSEGRLTLTSGTAVTSSDVTGAGTLYYTPHVGNRVRLYDGTRWKWYTFTERSLSLTLTSGKNYDVFLYDNAGTLTLELSAAWTNDTTRADALTTQDGVYVKSGATTRLYLGTIRASGSNTTEDSDAKRFVINHHNAVPRELAQRPGYNNDNAGTSMAETSTSYTPVNGGTNSKVEFLCLDDSGAVDISIHTSASIAGTGQARMGIGLDSTTTPVRAGAAGAIAGNVVSIAVRHTNKLALGYHYAEMLVLATSGTVNYLADVARAGAASDPSTTYIAGKVWG